MPKPTLLVKGSLVATEFQNQKELDKYVPIDYFIEWIRQRWKKEPKGLTDRILAVNSKTGSGKSTALPAAIVMEFLSDGGFLISTQPKRLTAMETPKSIVREPAYEGKFVLGENIGWSTGVHKHLPQQGLFSMTVDTLTMWLRNWTDEEIMDKAQFILIDEAHERSMGLDITLYMLKAFLQRNATNTRCPFVFLLSATFDPLKYAAYFGLNNHNVMYVDGISYPKEEHWPSEPSADYIKDAAEKALQIHNDNLNDDPATADILIFMTSNAEITKVEKILNTANEKAYKEKNSIFMILKLSSSEINMQTYSYEMVMAPHGDLIVEMGEDKDRVKPLRRIVITTSVAETGLTIDTLKYVIDSGWNKGMEFNPAMRIGGLLTTPAQQSRVTQRKGRVGRKFPGEFYALYTNETYTKLQKQQHPDIITEDISGVFLDMVRIQIELKTRMGETPEFRIEDIDMLDPPPVDSFMYCLEKNYMLGFISPSVLVDSSGSGSGSGDTPLHYNLTKMGMIASKIAIPAEAVRTILAGVMWDISMMDLITMMAFIFNPSQSYAANPRMEVNWLEIMFGGVPHYLLGTKRDTQLKLRILITDNFIEGLFLFHAVSRVMLHVGLKDTYVGLESYCNRVNLSFSAITSFIATREEFVKAFIDADIDPNNGNSLYGRPPEDFMDTIIRIKYCIYDGFRLNIATYSDKQNSYMFNGIPIETPPILSDDDYNHAKEQEYGISRKMMPKKIMFSKLNLSPDRASKDTPMYKATTPFISAIDGFINMDNEFY